MDEKARTAEDGKKLIARVKKEMQEPRLTESVREAGEDVTSQTFEERAAHGA